MQQDPQRHVFHILTDSLNYAAMQMWFWAYSPGKATVEIINLDDINTSNEQNRRKQLQLDTLQSSFLRVEEGSSGKQGILHYLPQIFPKLDKVFLLEDDIVILKDMSALWQLGTGNNMIIASDSCKASQEDGIWWSCVNIINLQECKNQRREEINPLPVSSFSLNGCLIVFSCV
jgi:alpha-1,4-galacturonosyltransferase